MHIITLLDASCFCRFTTILWHYATTNVAWTIRVFSNLSQQHSTSHVTIGYNRVAKHSIMLHPAMLWYVALKCCNCLAESSSLFSSTCTKVAKYCKCTIMYMYKSSVVIIYCHRYAQDCDVKIKSQTFWNSMLLSWKR